MDRILVIRGGAIGDFILTLPALKALRNAYPSARLELLAYKHIAALAEKRFYADATHSIEYGSLSGFFAKGAELNPELCDYFRGFDLVVSYLYDPDGIFEANIRRCGVRRIVHGPAKIDNRSHAVRQLLRPILDLGLAAEDLAPKIHPSPEDRTFAQEFLRGLSRPIVALHPGSGSESKNWAVANWIELGNELLNDAGRTLVVVGGEADEARLRTLDSEWKSNPRVRFAQGLPLPQLGALLENSLFLGHDSGISHLAAAAGASCILLFGPTDPAVWAPLNQDVEVIRPATGRIEDIDIKTVYDGVSS